MLKKQKLGKLCEQESDSSSNSSPLSLSNTGSSPAVTGSPTTSLDNRPSNCDAIDGILQKTNGEGITNGLRSYHQTNVLTIEGNGNENDNGNGIHITENGDDVNDDTSYRALDQLLASLALENDIMERHLSQINNNDTNGNGDGIKSKQSNPTTNGVFSFEPTANGVREHEHYNGSSNGGYRNVQTMDVFDENLNDVLANLIEFTENEALPQTYPTTNHHHTTSYSNGTMTNGTAHGHPHPHHHHHHHHHQHQQHHQQHTHNFSHFNNNFNHNNHINSNYLTSTTGNCNSNNTITTSHIHNHNVGRIVHNYQEPSNNAIKRLTSESENSSSVSPSLSERSNGIVSWSDQVCCVHKEKSVRLCLFSTLFFSSVPIIS